MEGTPDDNDMDIYSGLEESPIKKPADDDLCKVSYTQVDTTIDSEHNELLNFSKTENDSNFIPQDMHLFDELLVAENMKRKEKQLKDKLEHEDLLKSHEELQKSHDFLKKDNERLTKENTNLKTNICSLYKTAKAEIQLKESIISELQLELNELLFHRNSFHNRHDSRRDDYRIQHLAEKRDKKMDDSYEKYDKNREQTGGETTVTSIESKNNSELTERIDEAKPKTPVKSVEKTILTEISDCYASAIDSSSSEVPLSLQQALNEFERQQVKSLTVLKDAFSYYEKKQGSSTGALKEAVSDYYSPKHKTHKDSCSNNSDGKTLNAKQDLRAKSTTMLKESASDFSSKTKRDNHDSTLKNRDSPNTNIEEKHSHLNHNSESGSTFSSKKSIIVSIRKPEKYISQQSYIAGTQPLTTLYQKRLAARLCEEKDKEYEIASDFDVTEKKIRNIPMLQYPKLLSPLKSHHKAKSEDYLKARKMRFQKMHSNTHKTPEKFPTPLKNDAVNLFRYQKQPVPYAVQRKLGLLKSKSSKSQEDSTKCSSDATNLSLSSVSAKKGESSKSKVQDQKHGEMIQISNKSDLEKTNRLLENSNVIERNTEKEAKNALTKIDSNKDSESTLSTDSKKASNSERKSIKSRKSSGVSSTESSNEKNIDENSLRRHRHVSRYSARKHRLDPPAKKRKHIHKK